MVAPTAAVGDSAGFYCANTGGAADNVCLPRQDCGAACTFDTECMLDLQCSLDGLCGGSRC